MVPQRISFFYPVANSIDRSEDYWHRDTSFVADWFLQIGNNLPIEISKQPSKFQQTPYSVKFFNEGENYSIVTDYQFCKDKSAMIVGIKLTNPTEQVKSYKFDTRVWPLFRTSHTYSRIYPKHSEIHSNVIYNYFDNPNTDSTVLFFYNVIPGEKQHKQSSEKLETWALNRISINNKPQKYISQFIYLKQLKPGESLNITQIIGTCKRDESQKTVKYLAENYKKEVEKYERSVLAKVYPNIIKTGNTKTDHSLNYARAVVEANAHYLDGEIVPMPCPAEYNFFFTHDALVTDLTAVYCNPERVKKDLDFIISHANQEKIIPHAYYWKNGGYKTEYAGSDNWNNYWFIQVSAKYLRHTQDLKFIKKLYPYLTECIDQALLTLEEDNLIWSHRPDWWDIGDNYGPRSYMTILAIRSLKDYIYILVKLGKSSEAIKKYADLANEMQNSLIKNLWNSDMNYLVNYFTNGSRDEHYYSGSLLAGAYGLLDSTKLNLMLQTAGEKLLDSKIGIYNVYPMDFHRLGEFWNFKGNEAGQKHYYFNGGVWSQGNAWYALALIQNEQKQKAAEFIEKTMSLHGIMAGPNGQPAYYEVRNSNRLDSSEYGSIDKPQFLWAAAWYINVIYQLYGVRERNWNISLESFLRKNQKACEFQLYIDGKPLLINIHGTGTGIEQIKYDGKIVSTAVFPEDKPAKKRVDIKMGTPKQPYLKSMQAILKSLDFNNGKLKLILKAYPGNMNKTVIISPALPKAVRIDEEIYDSWSSIQHKGYCEIELNFEHKKAISELILEF